MLIEAVFPFSDSAQLKLFRINFVNLTFCKRFVNYSLIDYECQKYHISREIVVWDVRFQDFI